MNEISIINWVFYVFLCAIFLNFNAAKAEMTLGESVKAAYENNPELKAQGYSIEAVRSQKQKAYGGFLPNVSADFNNGSQKTKLNDGSATFKGNVSRKSVNLSQDLFNGGATYFDIQRADSNLNKEQATKDVKEQEILLNVIQAYINILRYQELLKIEDENLISQEQLLEHTKKKIQARDATRSELAKTNADYASAISSQIAVENNLISAKLAFAKLTGIPSNEIGNLRKIDDTIFYDKLEEISSNVLFEAALQNNPDLRVAKYSMDSARHQYSMSKSSLSPTVKFTVGSAEEKNPLYYSNRTYTNNSAYLNLHIPIFSSGVEYANMGEANNIMQREKYNLDSARIRIKQLIAEYLSKVKNSYAQYEALKEQESANEIYVMTTKEEERLGTKSIIDLLRAKQDLYNVKVNKTNLYYDKIIAVFSLKSLAGELTYKSLIKENTLVNFEEAKKTVEKNLEEPKKSQVPIIKEEKAVNLVAEKPKSTALKTNTTKKIFRFSTSQ